MLESDYSVPYQAGYTIFEFLVTMAVLAMLFSMGMPSMQGVVERRDTISAAEEVYSQLQFARSESVSRSAQVFANIADGDDWAIGISNDATCDPTDNVPACSLPDVNGGNAITQLFSLADHDSVSIDSTTAQITFSPQRATATAATIDVTSTGPVGYQMRVVVGVLGQISMCSPDADPVTNVAGYRAC